jgi:hypothetical protein
MKKVKPNHDKNESISEGLFVLQGRQRSPLDRETHHEMKGVNSGIYEAFSIFTYPRVRHHESGKGGLWAERMNRSSICLLNVPGG